jgi:hypothetical protein
MKYKKVDENSASLTARLCAAFLLLMVAFGANAADCNALYAATGAVPGSPTCRWDVFMAVCPAVWPTTRASTRGL